MNTIRLCPGCGAPVSADAPAGLCPQCLLKSDAGSQISTQASAPRSVPVPGGDFGDYRSLKLLGHGGMGEVYEAEHVTTGRRVALKVMRHTLASEQDRKRFLREGRLAASVNHPNVVYIHGSEEIDGAPAIAMELVHGGTLKDRLKREGPLPIADAAEAALQMIDGLEAAHAAGVLHRDIKPANCFVSSDGTVKVGDFGLSVSTLARGESLLTATGSVLGTPAYASPEQLRGEELDVTSDIYSVGATLYHLLTGKTPFGATDFVKLITEVLDKQPAPPKSLRPEIPAELSRILLRCLAKDRKARFQSYTELSDALLPFRASEAVPARPHMRFLAAMIDEMIAYGPSVIFLAYWSFDPLDNLARDRTWHAALVWLPFHLWYLLYYGVSEGLWGAAIGKSLLGLRVVGRDGQPPGLARAAIRVLVYMAAFTLPWFVLIATMSGEEVRAAMREGRSLFTDWAWLPLTALLYVTMRARNGYAAIQDFVSGTRVIVRPKTQPRPTLESLRASAAETSPAAAFALKNIGPYEVTGSLWKSGDEELALAFDPALRRRVWIHLRRADTANISEARRNLSRAARLRWIDGGQIDGRSWDAYEALEGAPFLAIAQRPQPWRAVRFWLLDLAEEGAAAIQCPETSPALALNRLWITASGRAVLLEFPAPGFSADNSHVPLLDGTEMLQQFLATVARAALEGAGEPSNDPHWIRALVPMHARGFLTSLARRTFDEARYIVGNLQSMIAKPAEVTRARRGASLAFVPGIAIACAALLVAMIGFERIRWDRAWAIAYPGQPSVRVAGEIYLEESEAVIDADLERSELERAAASKQGLHAEVKEAPGGRKDMELAGAYIAARFGPMITNDTFWLSQPSLILEPDLRDNLREAVQKHSAADAQTVAEAERYMEKRMARRERLQRLAVVWIGAGAALFVVFVAAVIDLIGTLAFNVSPLLRVFGFSLVTRNGARPPRIRSFARWALVWIPATAGMLFIAGIATSLAKTEPLLPVAPGIGILAILVAVMDVIMIHALLRPAASLPDRLAGTRLVPV